MSIDTNYDSDVAGRDDAKCRWCNSLFASADRENNLYCCEECYQADVVQVHIGYATELARLMKANPDVPRFELARAMYEEFSRPPPILDYSDEEIIEGMKMEFPTSWTPDDTEKWTWILPRVRDKMCVCQSDSQSAFLNIVKEIEEEQYEYECLHRDSEYECSCEENFWNDVYGSYNYDGYVPTRFPGCLCDAYPIDNPPIEYCYNKHFFTLS